MCKMLRIILVLCSLNCVFGNFIGPFVLWGRSELQTFDVPALESVDDKLLRNLYSESTAIVMFLRNSSNSLNVQNYPKFKDIIDESQWTYLSQHWLSSDPIDYNTNTEVYNLIGGASEQDVEIDEIYRNAIKKHGAGNVLGILATKSDNHDIYKRDTVAEPSPAILDPDEKLPNITYYKKGMAIMHTSIPPKFLLNRNETDLLYPASVTHNSPNKNGSSIDVKFVNVVNLTDQPILTLRFNFETANGYWSLNYVVVDGSKGSLGILNLTGNPIIVPQNFSYKCSQTVIFADNATHPTLKLTLKDIQVQPPRDETEMFDDAYNCVGFTTAPIWSGVIVTLFISAIIMLGLLCILEIKPPNKFENNRGKQLTFTVQE